MCHYCRDWRNAPREPARRAVTQQPSSLRTVHRGKYGSEIYAALPRTGGWAFWRKAPSPRATLLDAGEKAAICLATLVRTSNASPPAFLEGCCLRNPRSSSMAPAAYGQLSSRARDDDSIGVRAAIRDAGIAEQYRSSQTRRACAIIRRAQPGRADALGEQK